MGDAIIPESPGGIIPLQTGAIIGIGSVDASGMRTEGRTLD
jgi:hypothetical protein